MEQARTVLGLRGWAQPPQLSELWPSKAVSSENFVLTYKVDETEVEAFRFAANADIYGDGSCLHPHEEALSAVGFACAQRAADGRVWSISGPLPRWMPQTSAWAERTATMMARLHLGNDQPFVGRYRGDNVGALTPLARTLPAAFSGEAWRGLWLNSTRRAARCSVPSGSRRTSR